MIAESHAVMRVLTNASLLSVLATFGPTSVLDAVHVDVQKTRSEVARVRLTYASTRRYLDDESFRHRILKRVSKVAAQLSLRWEASLEDFFKLYSFT